MISAKHLYKKGQPILVAGRGWPLKSVPPRSYTILSKDPDQLNNVADKSEYAEVNTKLANTLMTELEATKDPRVLGEGNSFYNYPYYGSLTNK